MWKTMFYIHIKQQVTSLVVLTAFYFCYYKFKTRRTTNVTTSSAPVPVVARSVAARLLGLQVRIPSESLMSVSSNCFVLSGRCLSVEPITRPEDFYRVCCVWVSSRNLENKGALGHWGGCVMGGVTSLGRPRSHWTPNSLCNSYTD